MGSLKKIMNLDDEHHIDSQSIRRERRSISISTLEQDQSLNMPRYSASLDYPPTPQYSSRRHSPPYPLHSSAVPLGSCSPPGDRRRSNISIESMESAYGHAETHGNAYLAASMRVSGTAAAAAGGEHPVKLTPITGRVSRAKKGVPVHTCEICRPPKTFTRAEHLRRHQLSHQPPELACTIPGCDKVFHRKDLLERHQQRHEQDEKSIKDVGQSSRRSFSASSPSRGYVNSPPILSLQMQSPFGGPSSSGVTPSIPDMSMSSGHWSSVSESSRRGNALSSPPMREAQSAFHMGDIKNEYVVNSVPGIQASNTRIMSGYDEPRATVAMGVLGAVPDLCLSDPASSGITWPDGLPSSASGSTYSSPPSVHQPPSRTPSMEWTGQIASFPTSSSPIMASGGYPVAFGYATTPPHVYSTMYGDVMGLPLPGYEDNGSMYGPHILDTVRSLSPQLLVGQSSNTLVTTPAALPSDRSTYSRALGREPVDALGLFMSQDMMSVNLSREIRSSLPAYLEVYWDKAHSLYPIIHKPTFESASDMAPEHLDILQCAMAAIATQFLEHREHRHNGHQLHAYSWEKSRVYTTSQEWPLPIMQSVLLCEYYARFRGRSKKAYQPSLRFETLYQMVINMQNTNLSLNLSACNESQQWKIWVDMESRRRLLSACFLLDVHGMSYLEQPPVGTLGFSYASPEALPIPLSVGTSQLWDAHTYQEWSNMNDSGAILTTVGNTLLGELSAADIAAIPAFDAALLQATHVLLLPQRQMPTKLDLQDDASSIDINQFDLVNLFPYSPSAMTYLALHHTPLHTLLSVSGDSWVFNKKILRAGDFAEHQSQLRKWRDSGSAALAVTFAARALSLFLGLQISAGENGNVLMTTNLQGSGPGQYREISDFWGVYVCALICWAFGHAGSSQYRSSTTATTSSRSSSSRSSRSSSRRPSRSAALRWIIDVADMQPGQVQEMSDQERQDAPGAISLARASLERECLGGRNMLLADALGVLKKLEEGDKYRYF